MIGPTHDPRAAQRATLRRAVLQLVSGVVVLDVAAMAVYYLGHVQQSSSRTRILFIIAWTVATAVTVAVLLRRVRLARVAGRQPRR